MRHKGHGFGVLGNRAAAEPSERAQPVIHDDGAGGGEIERKGGRNPREVLAARGKLRA
jgi:hypothetical protein